MVKPVKNNNTRKRHKKKPIRKTYRRKYKMKRIYGGRPTSKSPDLTLTEDEKNNVKAKLKLLLNGKDITDLEYQKAVKQIDKKDGLAGLKEGLLGNQSLGIHDTMVSIMSPIQSLVQVVGDWFIRPPEIDEINGRQTVVKLLKFKPSAKTFVKGSLGDKGADIGLDEYMVVIQDSHNTAWDKLSSDFLTVDNLLANVINGCIGPGCKDGNVHPEVGLEKTIEIIDNKNKKQILNEMKNHEEKKKIEDSKLSFKPTRYQTK